MTVSVTLRYLSKTVINIRKETEIFPGCTAGDLSNLVISEEEEKKGIRFSGASVVTLVNGRVASPDRVLEDGDEIKIFPVAAAG